MIAVALLAGLNSACKPRAILDRDAAPALSEEDGSRIPVQTGRIEIEQRDEDGSQLWEVEALSSRLGIDETGIELVMMAGVTAKLYREGELVSRATAPEAKADRTNSRLVLYGGVVLIEETRRLTLNADTVVYQEAKEIIEASGNITVSSDSMTMGVFERLWSTPDLTRIATPDRF